MSFILRIIKNKFLHNPFYFWSDWLWFGISSGILVFIDYLFLGMVKRDEDICSTDGLM
jgi:hypothetical protein